MDLIQKAKEAIMKAEHTSNVVVVSLSYDISMSYGGIREAKARVWLGKRMKTTREYTMYWDAEKEEFVNINPKPDLISSFKREYNDFKISSMTEEELFALLRKANSRRKSAERKLRLKQAKCRRISADSLRQSGTFTNVVRPSKF